MHHPGGFTGFSAIFLCRHVPDLPLPVHFIPQTPVPDIVWLCRAVGFPQFTVISSARKIAVFHQFLCSFRGIGPQIHRIDRLCTGTAAPFDEFIQTFDIQPGDGMYMEPTKRINVW